MIYCQIRQSLYYKCKCTTTHLYYFVCIKTRLGTNAYNSLVNNDNIVCPDKDELAGGKFWSKEEIINNMNKNVFTPNFEKEYQKFFMDK